MANQGYLWVEFQLPAKSGPSGSTHMSCDKLNKVTQVQTKEHLHCESRNIIITSLLKREEFRKEGCRELHRGTSSQPKKINVKKQLLEKIGK